MRYIKVLILVLSILAAIIFGIHNPMPCTLSFLSYRLIPDIPLWALILLSFLSGTLPIILVSLPEKTAFMKNMRELKLKKKNIEKSLKSLSAAKPSEGV
ncbi:MAG TPA: LapA family protein [Desulfomonilia bacterium]